MPGGLLSNPESHGVEDYLEAIYELQEEGDRVVQARISRRLGVTRASVSEQVARLQKMRLVESNARAITLTPHGFAVAEDAVRKHRLAERFLVDVLRSRGTSHTKKRIASSPASQPRSRRAC
jgi:DtxR family Mn-dependent transcriptional regulator